MLKQLFILVFISTSMFASAQKTDSLPGATTAIADSIIIPAVVPAMGTPKVTKAPPPPPTWKPNPRKATIYSAIFPGLGQFYNREPWWRIGLVYAAVSIPAIFFVDNNIWYHRARVAYEIKVNEQVDRYPEIHEQLQRLDAPSIQFYRNEFRKNRDYSALFFILAWGLNVVDATVYAHLKGFDVTDDLSIQIKPTIDPSSGAAGASLVLLQTGNKKKIKHYASLSTTK